jgi:hypothetical protein
MNDLKELSIIFIVLSITLIMVLIIETILLPFTIISFIKKVYGKINKRIRRQVASQ